MAMEDKKDNKVDTGRNGRPINLNIGGEDMIIDLPSAIPGQESINTDDLSDDELENLLAELNKNRQDIEDLLKQVGIDDINKFNFEDTEK